MEKEKKIISYLFFSVYNKFNRWINEQPKVSTKETEESEKSKKNVTLENTEK